ncbi:MAG: response regulator transcription factor, partial [Rhizomicrobium sp.]
MTAKPPRILIVDDEPQIRRFLRVGLPPHGYVCLEATDGAEAMAVFAHEKPDVVILDLGLPDRDGFEILSQMRAQALTPILILSARSDVAGKVKALEAGADDYVTKPFDMEELLARLQTALRHGLQVTGEAPVFRSGPLAVDLVKRQVFLADEEVHLSPKEYEVLRFLVQHAGKVVTHQQLLHEAWGPAHVEDVQYLRVLMR